MHNMIEIAAAMATMAQEMSIRHVFDDTLQDRGTGVLRYVLAIGVERYLAWHDDDADEMVVSPFGLWGAETVVEVIDDAVPVWFVREGGKLAVNERHMAGQLGNSTSKGIVF